MRPLTTMAALCFALVGCTSYADLRAQAPLVTRDFSGNRVSVAACTADELRVRDDMHYIVTERPDQKTTRIAAETLNMVGGPMGAFAWEITFSELNGNTVRTEVRAVKSIFGKPAYPSDLFSLIESCGGHSSIASDSPTKR